MNGEEGGGLIGWDSFTGPTVAAFLPSNSNPPPLLGNLPSRAWLRNILEETTSSIV